MISINSLIEKIPEGYAQGMFYSKKYGITKQIFNDGKSLKIYAKELKGTDFVSLNYYKCKNKNYLKPCEMSQDKVIEFLKDVKIIEDGRSNC